MKKLTWGVLSTSKFAGRSLIPATKKSKYSEVTAVASRDKERATTFAAKLNIPKTYGSYEALIADPSIDVVYIPLPNNMHVDWALKALEAGKHVLCEKPVGLNYADARRLENASRDYPKLKVMEAFMYRHHPQWRKVKELVVEQAIGDIKTVHSIFSYYNVDTSNIRNISEVGGGAMLDIGCYCVSQSRFVFGSEPERVAGLVERDPRTKIDRFSSGMLDFGSGTAAFSCGTQMQPYQRVNILGTKGRIEIEVPFNAPNDQPCRIWLQRGGPVEEITFDVCDQYTIQVDLFAEAIMNNTPVPTPIEDGISNMKVIDAVFESSARGGWIKI